MSSRGMSAPSKRSELVCTPSSAPGSCRALTVRQAGAAEACLSWQPPAEMGGAAITAYQVTRWPAVGGAEAGETTCISATVGQNPHWVRYTVSELEPGVEYTFGVCAVSSAGVGEASSLSWSLATARGEDTAGKRPIWSVLSMLGRVAL